MIKGMDHVGISVSDLDRGLAFYRDLLGMEVVVQGAFDGEQYETLLNLRGVRGRVVLLRRGNFQIELFEFGHPDPKPSDSMRPVCDHGITHFCLEVTNIHEEYERLKAAGVHFHCPPLKFFGKAFATYARDPDGNVFELFEMIS